MHWATLGLFVDFLIRLVAGPGPSVLTQLARLPVARMKPRFTYGGVLRLHWLLSWSETEGLECAGKPCLSGCPLC